MPLPIIIKSYNEQKCELWIQRDDEKKDINITVTGEDVDNHCKQIDFLTLEAADVDMLIQYLKPNLPT